MISISKIRNINLIKKNWILKGIRGLEIGSNPHSNDEFFSRDLSIFFAIIKFMVSMIKGISNIIIIINIIFKI